MSAQRITKSWVMIGLAVVILIVLYVLGYVGCRNGGYIVRAELEEWNAWKLDLGTRMIWANDPQDARRFTSEVERVNAPICLAFSPLRRLEMMWWEWSDPSIPRKPAGKRYPVQRSAPATHQ
jgi:hypothetical protein